MLVYLEPVALLLFAASLLGAGGLQITQLNVPTEVQNNSEHIILDCVYTLKQDEAERGLVVKWYFNNGPMPVYQWIPGKKPQDLGVLRGKLKLDHEATKQGATMFRALYIRNPTTELTGEYKCHVSTFEDEDFMTKKMIVYATGHSFELTRRKPDSENVIITCSAKELYPEPKISISKTVGVELMAPEVNVFTKANKGSYDIEAIAHLKDVELDSPTFFNCDLKIPDTSFSNKKSMAYYPALGALSAPPLSLTTLLLSAGAALSLRWLLHRPLYVQTFTARAC